MCENFGAALNMSVVKLCAKEQEGFQSRAVAIERISLPRLDLLERETISSTVPSGVSTAHIYAATAATQSNTCKYSEQWILRRVHGSDQVLDCWKESSLSGLRLFTAHKIA